MVSAIRAIKKRCAITISIDGHTKSGPEEHEKIKQFLMHPDEKSDPEKIVVFNKNKFVVLDICVEICDGTQKITIPKKYIEYSGSSKAEIAKSGELKGEIEETIKIYASSTIHEKETFWAALNLSIEFKENLKKEMIFPIEVGSFMGTGTGALNGALLEGIDKITRDFECAESPTGWGASYARIGFINGWPSEVNKWPPSCGLSSNLV